jgi:hypothetical protein
MSVERAAAEPTIQISPSEQLIFNSAQPGTDVALTPAELVVPAIDAVPLRDGAAAPALNRVRFVSPDLALRVATVRAAEGVYRPQPILVGAR